MLKVKRSGLTSRFFQETMPQSGKPERTDMNPAFFWLIYLTSSSV